MRARAKVANPTSPANETVAIIAETAGAVRNLSASGGHSLMAGGDRKGREAVGGLAVREDSATFAARARGLGLPFAPTFVLSHSRLRLADPKAVIEGRIAFEGGGGPAYIAPKANALPSLACWLAEHPAIAARLVVSTPTAIRAALTEAGGAGFLAAAVGRVGWARAGHAAARGV
jgi:hypothetical protein